MSGRLVVCPTPIGNLEDVTLRVLSALRDATVIACEDTRRTRVLLERYGVSAKLVSYHEHNERARATQLVERMQAGRRRRARVRRGHAARSAIRASCSCARASRRGSRSRCCRGPSAALSALVASALPSDTWRFVGYLPRKQRRVRGAVPRARDDRRVRVAQPRRGVAAPRSPRSTRSARSSSAAS